MRQVLALPQLHLGLGPAGAQRRDLEARRSPGRWRSRATTTSGATLSRMAPFRAMLGVNRSLMPNSLNVMLIDAAAAAALDGGIGELTAGQEVGFLARQGHQVGLGQGAQVALGDRRLDQGLDLGVTAVEQEADGGRRRPLDR